MTNLSHTATKTVTTAETRTTKTSQKHQARLHFQTIKEKTPKGEKHWIAVNSSQNSQNGD